MPKKSNAKPRVALQSNTALSPVKEATNPIHPIMEKAIDVVKQGSQNALIIGIRVDGSLVIDATVGSYEELHGLLNRAVLKVTVAHENYLEGKNPVEKEDNAEDN